MLNLIVEYILCYSSAFLLGLATGICMMIVVKHKPSPLAIRRRKRDGKRVC